MQQVLDELGVSRRALELAFQRHLGVSPHQYLLVERLHLARTMLKRNEASILEICLNSGFTHPSRFAEMYARHFRRIAVANEERNSGSSIESQQSLLLADFDRLRSSSVPQRATIVDDRTVAVATIVCVTKVSHAEPLTVHDSSTAQNAAVSADVRWSERPGSRLHPLWRGRHHDSPIPKIVAYPGIFLVNCSRRDGQRQAVIDRFFIRAYRRRDRHWSTADRGCPLLAQKTVSMAEKMGAAT